MIARNCYGTKITCKNLNKYLSSLSWPDGQYNLDCRLIGYRGKERQKLFELSKYLDGHKSKVSRLDLKIYGFIGNDLSDKLFAVVPSLVVLSETTKKDNLSDAVKRLSTRHGVEIVDCQTEITFLLSNNKRAFQQRRCKKHSNKIQ